MTHYIALIRKDADSDYGVEFPDLPGCVTAGRTLDEAQRMAPEALALHLQGMQEDGDPIPEPSSMDTVMVLRENRDAVAFMVETPGRPAKSVRINVMLPEGLIQQIDRASPNRSRFLAEAAEAKLRRA